MSLQEKIFKAGIVGCGGAGFPTHKKLEATPEIFIVNGAECEPLLHTDRHIMCNYADRLVEGVEIVCKEIGAKKGVIALKRTYTKEISALKNAINNKKSKVTIFELDSFYPAGDEQIIAYEVLKQTVPPSGIPIEVGAVIDNVATVLAIRDAWDDIPFTDKYLTVTGQINNPSVIKVPLGTSFSHCIELCGGTDLNDYFVVSGGPMMGKLVGQDDLESTFVTKTTSGIIVLPIDNDINNRHKVSIKHMLNRAKSACIQCSFCTQLCSRNLIGHPLEPHKIMRKVSSGLDISQNLDDEVIKSAAICSECGICEIYACPMGLAPKTINQLIKGELAKAGIRYERKTREYTANPQREYRKIPTGKVAQRVGVGKYYQIKDFDFISDSTKKVELSLKMHIGAACVPCVKSGDNVQKGQMIATCPEGALGTNLHASISGKVKVSDNSILIEG